MQSHVWKCTYIYMFYNSQYESGCEIIFIYKKCAIYTCAIFKKMQTWTVRNEYIQLFEKIGRRYLGQSEKRKTDY